MSDKNQEYQKNVSEQSGVEGQRKEVNVESYPGTVAFAQILKDVEFPTSKSKLIEHVRLASDSNEASTEAIKRLDNIEDRQYENVADVTRAAGLVH